MRLPWLTFTDVNADDVTFTQNAGADLVITLSNGETITVTGHFANLQEDMEQIVFADGTVLDAQAIRDKSVADQKSDGAVITGSQYVENYSHSLGDGSYTIADFSYINNADTLTLTDVNVDDVTFTQNAGADLVITLSNGETITVMGHFANTQEDIEQIVFADGTVLEAQAIRDKSVADQKSDGAIITGSEYVENYSHSLGDGSYTIADFSYVNNTDTLAFTDVNVADVSFSQNAGADLVITLSNGETITVTDHFANTQEDIEQIVFADGTVLSGQAILDKSVADVYTYTLGDGTAVIDSLGSGGANSRLAFADVNINDVTFAQNPDQGLVITLSDGETITITGHFINPAENIGLIEFADGTQLDAQAVSDKSVADTEAAEAANAPVDTSDAGSEASILYNYHSGETLVYGTGAAEALTATAATLFFALDGDDTISGGNSGNILVGGLGDDTLDGGNGADTYVYSFGDGNDTINDLSYSAGNDRLSFTDVNASDVSFSQDSGESLIITLSNGETITVTDHFEEAKDESIEEIVFADGTVLDMAGIRQKSIEDQKAGGSGTILGSDFAETYAHSLGDGSYTIADWDNNARTDRLVFTDVNASDVTFSQDSGESLIITLSNGETITVADHFEEVMDESIEEIAFADGTVLDMAGIRQKSIEDQKAGGSGTILGSDFAETYAHSLGDGSYTIADWDNNARTDRLVFTDVNASDVSFSQDSGESLIITLSNGETITVADHFEEVMDESIEEIVFADGTVLDMAGIRQKSIEDQKAGGSGTILGSDFAETYAHSLGDGSYTIADWDNNARTDRLVFTDVNASDVTFSQDSGESLIITLSNGETITVADHFEEVMDESIEEIAFADGTVLDMAGIRQKSIEDQKAGGSGTILGSDFAETYAHSLGDGSYTIVDYDNNGRIDEFIFTDVNAADVTIERLLSDPDDVVLTLLNGEQILLENQLETNYGVECVFWSHFTGNSDFTLPPILILFYRGFWRILPPRFAV